MLLRHVWTAMELVLSKRDVTVGVSFRHFDQLRLVEPGDNLLDRRLGRAATLRG